MLGAIAQAWHSGERGASVSGTQLNYAAWAQRCASASVRTAPALNTLRLLSPARPAALLHLRDGAVVLYRRAGSLVWQVRFKLWDQRWHRLSTRHRDKDLATRAAGDIYDRAKFCEASGVPLSTRRFGAVAALTLQALEAEIEQGVRPMSNRDYQRVITKYLVPFFGKRLLTNINAALVREYEVWRNQRMGRAPQASTLMTHAAAYRRVWDTAVQQGWLSERQAIPALSRRGARSQARPAFSATETAQLRAFMCTWCAAGGHRHTSRQIKWLLRDHVEILLGTGMRCGTESMGMLWQHVQWHTDSSGQRYLRLWVTGKTGARWLIAKHDTAQAFERLAQRQRHVARSLDEAIAAQLPVPVFALDDGTQPYGLAGTFARLLQAAGLSRDPQTGQPRTLYSLRHTYATAELLSGTDIHTLARQMGTSVHMLERHYSKLTATMAAGQLA